MRATAGAIIALGAVLGGPGEAAEPPLKLTDPAVPVVHRPASRPAAARPRPPATGAAGSDWATFLGPSHNGVSPETALRKDFTTPPRLLWRMVKGAGYAAPAVAGGCVVVLHRVGNREVVECLHAERGTLQWRLRYPTAYRDRFGYNAGPRASPAVAGGRVFTYGAEGKLHCLDLRTGKVLWRRDLAREFAARSSFFGAGASPLVVGGRVIVNVGGKGGPSVVALDAATGRLAWGAEKHWGAGYASPIPATIHGRRVVFVFAGGESDPATGGVLCLDPRTGATHFRFPWRSRRVYSVNASSPVVTGETVFISSHYDIGGVLLRVRADLTHEVVYRTGDLAAHWMTPIARGGYLYGFSDATLVCMKLATGRVAWSTKPAAPAGAGARAEARRGFLGRASMIFADGAFLCLGEYGDLCWMDLSPKGAKITAQAKLFHAPQTWTAPVLSRGLLYVCRNHHDARSRPPALLCYDLRPGP